MPLPNPHTGESKDIFIQRFMADETANADFPDAAQRRAVAERQWEQAQNMQFNDIYIESNQAVTRQLQGRDHVVVPAVILKKQVLHGHGPSYQQYGPGLVTEETLQNSLPLWNGTPLTITADDNHPIQSARTIDVQDQIVGKFLNGAVKNDKIVGELWIDMALASRTQNGSQILKKALKGKPFGLSTGYMTEIEVENGTYNGREYGWIQRNLQPDHIALFNNTTGACSLRDGCGGNLNKWADNMEDNDQKAQDYRTSNQMSFDDIQEIIAQAIRDAEGGQNTYIFPYEVYDNYVIYEREIAGKGAHLYRREYSIMDEKVTLGSPTEVKKVETYEPVENIGNKNILHLIKKTITNIMGGKTMNEKQQREAYIKVIANAGFDLPDDALENEKVSTCYLQGLAEGIKNRQEPQKPEKNEPQDSGVNADTVEAIKNAIFDSEEFQSLKADAENRKAQEQKEKEKVIQYLTKNQLTGMDEAELKQQHLHVLKEIARAANGGMEINYGMNNTGEKEAENRKRARKPKPVFINTYNKSWDEIDAERSES